MAKSSVTNHTNTANPAAKPGASQLALAIRPTPADFTARALLMSDLRSACRRYRLILAKLRLAKTRRAELEVYTSYAILIAMSGEGR